MLSHDVEESSSLKSPFVGTFVLRVNEVFFVQPPIEWNGTYTCRFAWTDNGWKVQEVKVKTDSFIGLGPKRGGWPGKPSVGKEFILGTPVLDKWDLNVLFGKQTADENK